ncbi:LysM domain-containing protein [Beauveria brongniartii RCEF 3172]|uniref:LysM domain-containing protein n=1 Tax=Beauveria brongniartii RCEF 3172 TaxID=1081107 RepID=A0A167CRL5_9HYPO|nr:LysM domain-containing protein [Beauveria brongniartii RCEF 3172]
MRSSSTRLALATCLVLPSAAQLMSNTTSQSNMTASPAFVNVTELDVAAIHLFGNTTQLPPSASSKCAAALMAGISCSLLVSPMWMSGHGSFDAATLTDLCTPSCEQSLKKYQVRAENACGYSAYTFPAGNNASIPSLVDPVLWAYNTACIKSGSDFCVPLLTQGNGQGGGNGSAKTSFCSDCFLKYEAAMIAAPYGGVQLQPDDFSSLLSSCSKPATSYPYTTRTAGPGPTTSSAPAAKCTGSPYTVKSGDTCESIASANSIATDRFITDNDLDYNCTAISARQSVCLPESCKLHRVATGDTCDSILKREQFYLTQLLSWNPTIHANCDNLASMAGRDICISPPGTTKWDSGPPTDTTTSWNVTFVLPTTEFTVVPSQTIVPNYTTSYQGPTDPIQISTTTGTIVPSAAESYAALTKYCPISHDDFLGGWTIPDLPANCSSALGKYCSPAANATMPSSTVFPTTCSPAYYISQLSSSGPPAPTGDGTVKDCKSWYVVANGDTCQKVVDKYGISLAQFYSWNPSVGSDCRLLQAGYAVCVGTGDTSSTPGSTPISTAPSPTASGTDPKCTQYYFVNKGDSCYNIKQQYHLSDDQFNTWNPSVGADCSGLFAGQYICVGAPYKSTSTSSPTPTATGPSPQEPSTDPQCTKWHYVVAGDNCFNIENKYDITSDQAGFLPTPPENTYFVSS